MIPASYGWAGLAAIILAVLIVAVICVRRGKAAAVESAARAAACDDAGRKAKEHENVAEVERRDLPPGVAGPRVQPSGRDKLGKAPGPPGA